MALSTWFNFQETSADQTRPQEIELEYIMNRKAYTLIGLAWLSISSIALAEDTTVKAEPLIKAPITGVNGHDLLMTRVHIAADTTLPLHSHLTEEFLYILEGEAFLRIAGQDDRLLTAGAAVVIPAGAIHTAVTQESDAIALTTRVHPEGQPVRIPAPAPATKE